MSSWNGASSWGARAARTLVGAWVAWLLGECSGSAKSRGRSGSAELDGTSGDEGELDGSSGDKGELDGSILGALVRC